MPDPEIPVVPPVVPPTPPDPAAALRAELDALKTSLATEKTARETAEAAKTALERAAMTEADRVKAELADATTKAAALDPLRDELGKYVAQFETMYKSELASVPEEKRTLVETLSKTGSWADRVAAIQTAKTLAGVASGPMGGALNPGGGSVVPPAATFTIENAPRLSQIVLKS